MKFNTMTKKELKSLITTKLGGTDGDLYLDSSLEKILKVLYSHFIYENMEEKKLLLERLYRWSELRDIAATPIELVQIFETKKIGFWAKYYKNGIPLDEWTKINKGNTKKVLEMYQKISKILKELHEKYGIIVSDCNYKNILIIDDSFPILVDVNSFSMEDIRSNSVSRMLYDYSRKIRLNRYQQEMYLRHSKNSDKAALWLMYLEAALELPVRKIHYLPFNKRLRKEGNIDSSILEILDLVSDYNLSDVPYLHEIDLNPKEYRKIK